MADEDQTSSRKPGLFGRLFGRGGELPAPAAAPEAPASEPAPKRSWWQRLKEGLSRSSSTIGKGIAEVFTKRRLDSAMLDDLEDLLIQADLGVATATRIRDTVGKGRYDKTIEPEERRSRSTPPESHS